MKTVILMMSLSGLSALGGQVPTASEIANRMMEREQARQSSLGVYTWMSHYTLDNKERHAEMMVQWTREGDGTKHYAIAYERGDGAVREHVFQKLLESEVEASQPGLQSRNRLNDKNYAFRWSGSEEIKGRAAYILDVEPKTESKFLIKGRVWIDAADYAVVKVEGSPAKKPSFWTNAVSFVQTFEKAGDYWMAASNRSVTEAKLFGEADLAIKHSNYRFGPTATMMASN